MVRSTAVARRARKRQAAGGGQSKVFEGTAGAPDRTRPIAEVGGGGRRPAHHYRFHLPASPWVPRLHRTREQALLSRRYWACAIAVGVAGCAAPFVFWLTFSLLDPAARVRGHSPSPNNSLRPLVDFIRLCLVHMDVAVDAPDDINAAQGSESGGGGGGRRLFLTIDERLRLACQCTAVVSATLSVVASVFAWGAASLFM